MLHTSDAKSPADNVGEIVNKIKGTADQLRLAILHLDNLTKDCFETTVSELTKTVDNVKKRYSVLDSEYQAVKKEVKAGELRLNNIMEEYKEILEENSSLEEIETGLLSQNTILHEHKKTANELSEKLRIYKFLTGVRFDFNNSEDTLTGYIAISGNQPSNSTLIPFEIDKNDNNKKQVLLEKINQACSEIVQ